MKPVRVWNLINAYPVKWTGGDLNASSTEILTESLEVAHSGMAITAVAA
jgi:phage tail-like protein